MTAVGCRASRPIDAGLPKQRRLSLHRGLTVTRSLLQTPDPIARHRPLPEPAQPVDAGVLRSRPAGHFATTDAAHLGRAHAPIASGRSRAKVLLPGF